MIEYESCIPPIGRINDRIDKFTKIVSSICWIQLVRGFADPHVLR